MRVYLKDVLKSRRLLLDIAARHSLNSICTHTAADDQMRRLVLSDVTEEDEEGHCVSRDEQNSAASLVDTPRPVESGSGGADTLVGHHVDEAKSSRSQRSVDGQQQQSKKEQQVNAGVESELQEEAKPVAADVEMNEEAVQN